MKFFKRKSAGYRGGVQKGKKDVPVIHQSVPDEVLYPEGKPEPVEEMTWLDEKPAKPDSKPQTKPTPSPEEPAPEWTTSRSRPTSEPSSSAAPEQAAAPAPANAPIPQAAMPAAAMAAESAPNQAVAGRIKNPVGWLVVVEGPGVGEWFVLQNGTSHIGSGAGQTVHLNFGDTKVAESRHAAVIYDDKTHAFGLDGDASANLRLNGQPVASRTLLRDGDVFTVGETSLRLVALCTPNFHWS